MTLHMYHAPKSPMPPPSYCRPQVPVQTQNFFHLTGDPLNTLTCSPGCPRTCFSHHPSCTMHSLFSPKQERSSLSIAHPHVHCSPPSFSFQAFLPNVDRQPQMQPQNWLSSIDIWDGSTLPRDMGQRVGTSSVGSSHKGRSRGMFSGDLEF